MSFPTEETIHVDALVVGSGAAGLTAALRLVDRGLKPLLIEKSSMIGGTTCYSGGSIWIPNNSISQNEGVLKDSFEEALQYLDATVGPSETPATSPERRVSFLQNGPRMVEFLQGIGFRWRPCKNHPDVYSRLPGGKTTGRTIEGQIFDARQLGEWQQHLQQPPYLALPIYCHEGPFFFLMWSSLAALFAVVRILLVRLVWRWLVGQSPVTLGRSLVGQLLQLCLERNGKVTIWRNSPLKRLVLSGNEVNGAIVQNAAGKEILVRASHGVVLAAGGFAWNSQMRQAHQRSPTADEWTLASPEDQGDAINAGTEAGAAVALMDESWGAPMTINPVTKVRQFVLFERSLPHTIMVNAAGERLTNESGHYNNVAREQYKSNERVKSIPMWMILDTQHRNRYSLAEIPPRYTPASALSGGVIFKANTIDELCAQIQVDAGRLSQTIDDFNNMVSHGTDEVYHRGEDIFDRYYGDPNRNEKNPNLGSIEKPPFYAVAIYPGDLGTKGGLLTDEHARVLRQDLSPIEGLYAIGNTSASIMGRTYPGYGSTLGPAMAFGYIASNHIAGRAGFDE